MKVRPTQILSFLTVFLCMNAFSASLEEVKRETKNVKNEIKREKELHQSEKVRANAFKKSSTARLKKMKSQISIVQARRDSLKAELSHLRQVRKKMGGSIRWYAHRRESLSGFLAMQIDSLIPEIESGFPYRVQEQVASLRSLSSQLNAGTLGPEEGMNRLWSQLLDMLKSGMNGEHWSGRFTPDGGSSIAGKYLRFGGVFQAFISTDAKDIWWLSLSDQNKWQWKNANQDLKLRQSIKDAFDVIEGKSVPKLVKIPVHLPLEVK